MRSVGMWRHIQGMRLRKPALDELARVQLQQQPKPQQTLRSGTWGGISVGLLILVASILAIFAFVKANFTTAEMQTHLPWRLTLLSFNEALTLLIALLGLSIVRRQFAMGTRPFLIYTSYNTKESLFVLHPQSTPARIWKVVLKNVGPGLAIINSVRYRLTFQGEPTSHEFALVGETLIKQLDTAGIHMGTHFDLILFSAGAPLGAGSEIVMFEILPEVMNRLSVLDVEITFSGTLGDRFLKEIFLIPRASV
jgi:hypothetical protein